MKPATFLGAVRRTTRSSGFNAIQGLEYTDGRLYVMHSPYLTVLRDTNGTGIADERRDLLVGLGWTPEKAPDRLHGANGVVFGRDGWLYLALGDRGCDVLRPEGDRLVLHGGRAHQTPLGVSGWRRRRHWHGKRARCVWMAIRLRKKRILGGRAAGIGV